MRGAAKLEVLADLLTSRGASLYHACQLDDFESYLRLGSIASPGFLQGQGLALKSRPQSWPGGDATPDGVFFSFSDHGETFAKKLDAVPNPAGPILFQLEPQILHAMQEMDVYLRPQKAGPVDEGQRIRLTAEDCAYLFRYTQQAPYPERLQIRSAAQIQAAFNTRAPMIPEIYCRPASGTIAFSQATAVMVDSYLIFRRQLNDWVYDVELLYETRLPLKRRYCPADNGGHLSDAIAAWLMDQPPELENLIQSSNDDLKQWALQLERKKLHLNFRQYAAQLQNGTLFYIKKNRERFLNSGRHPSSDRSDRQPPPIARALRVLIDKLQAEAIPLDSIARITNLSPETIAAYLKQK